MTSDDPESALPRGLRPEYEVTPQATARRVDDAGYFILDCRLPEEFEASKLAGSLLIPLHQLEDRLDELADEIEDRGMSKDAPFAVLCHHGQRSLRATLLLHQFGFTGARSIFGGIELWSTTEDALIPRYSRNGSRCTIVQ